MATLWNYEPSMKTTPIPLAFINLMSKITNMAMESPTEAHENKRSLGALISACRKYESLSPPSFQQDGE
ncbi:hypothetical protein V6N12_029070 [Hibiscus sabdariffa]|uniref:Uncharacterized protein n=1 Tax=Hibiscus sabdariffa TaxID=183260 RepID=A0ABR2F7N5_9ROSI